MCGIAGIFKGRLPGEEYAPLLATMGDALRHRGPDETGSLVLQDQRAGLTCRRLSLVDVPAGHQPMSNEDGSVHVVFNGEIYNHDLLRKQLTARGHRFRTRCDTEAIVHLYEEHGIECLDKLHGMFALAVLDKRSDRLLLARDGPGMKSLYWTSTERGFLFASEVKALLASGLVDTKPDPLAIEAYLAAGYIPAPLTGFEGIEKLPAGGWLSVEKDGVRRGRFWRPRFREETPRRSEDDYAAELEHLLQSAVRSHLAADVPVGAFVSGGWDSSLVASFAARSSPRKLKTFSIVFPDDPDMDEGRYSRQVADDLGSEHHEVEFRAAEAPDLFPKMVRALEEPNARAPSLLFYFLSEFASREVKTVVSGEGSDELFGGYNWFQSFIIGPSTSLRRVVPRSLGRALQPLHPHYRWQLLCRVLAAKDQDAVDVEWLRCLSCPWENDLVRPEFRAPDADLSVLLPGSETMDSCRNRLERLLALEFKGRLGDGLLLETDKMSMAHSLESRMPFLDREVVEFALSLPSDLKLRGRQEKYIISKLVHHLPAPIRVRKKFGLGYPRGLANATYGAHFLRELLLDSSDGPGLLDRTRVESYLGQGLSPGMRGGRVLWTIGLLHCWWREFFG